MSTNTRSTSTIRIKRPTTSRISCNTSIGPRLTGVIERRPERNNELRQSARRLLRRRLAAGRRSANGAVGGQGAAGGGEAEQVQLFANAAELGEAVGINPNRHRPVA